MARLRRFLFAAVGLAGLFLAFGASAQSQSAPVGPGFQAITPTVGFPATIAASGSWSSGVLILRGYRGISATVTSTQAGVISIQRYVDAAGLIAIGTPITQAISASTLATVSVNDGLPAGYYQVTITNTSGSTATVTTPAIVMTGL